MRHFLRDDRGQDLIEYVLLGALMAIVVIGGVGALGTNVNTWYQTVADWASGQASAVPGA